MRLIYTLVVVGLLSGCSKRPAPEPTRAPAKTVRGKGTPAGAKPLPTGSPVVPPPASAASGAPSTMPEPSRAGGSGAPSEDRSSETRGESVPEVATEEPAPGAATEDIVTVSPHARYDADLALQIESDLMHEWARVEEEMDDIRAIEMIANIKAYFELRRMEDDEDMARLLFERDLLAEWNRLHAELKKADASPAEMVDELQALFEDRRAELEMMGKLSPEVEELLAADWNAKVDLVYGLDDKNSAVVEDEEDLDWIKIIRLIDDSQESRIDTLDDQVVPPRRDDRPSNDDLAVRRRIDDETWLRCFAMVARGSPVNEELAECREFVTQAIANDPKEFVRKWTMYMTSKSGELAVHPMTYEFCRRIVHITDAHAISVNFIRSLYQERKLTDELRDLWGPVFDQTEADRFVGNNLNFCRQQATV